MADIKKALIRLHKSAGKSPYIISILHFSDKHIQLMLHNQGFKRLHRKALGYYNPFQF